MNTIIAKNAFVFNNEGSNSNTRRIQYIDDMPYAGVPATMTNT